MFLALPESESAVKSKCTGNVSRSDTLRTPLSMSIIQTIRTQQFHRDDVGQPAVLRLTRNTYSPGGFPLATYDPRLQIPVRSWSPSLSGATLQTRSPTGKCCWHRREPSQPLLLTLAARAGDRLMQPATYNASVIHCRTAAQRTLQRKGNVVLQTLLVDMTYTADGNIQQETLGNGVVTRYEYSPQTGNCSI